jgi:hypothetical protein
MKVKFDFTLDDIVDASQRWLARSRVARSWYMQGYMMAGLIGFFVGFIVFPGSGAVKPLNGIVGASLLILIHHFTQKSAQKRRLLAYCREHYGSDGPYTCEVELAESGLITTQMGTQIKREWQAVKDVEETPDSVDIVLKDSLIVVRDRAFHSPDEKRQFLNLAKHYTNQSHHSYGQSPEN